MTGAAHILAMTDFTESQHPRINDGTFTEKEQSTPEVALGADASFNGETLTLRGDVPVKLRIEIDNEDAGEYPNHPFTLNVFVDDPESGEQSTTPLALGGGGGALIEGSVPAQLRELANLIEAGGVTR